MRRRMMMMMMVMMMMTTTTTMMRGWHGGAPRNDLGLLYRELCNNFLGFFLSKSPLPPFLPSQEVWDIERC